VKDGFLRLTEAERHKVGGAWYALPVHVHEGFQTEFDFRIDRDGAHGFAFVIQNTDRMALGWQGWCLGYNIPNSIAIEFDTQANWPGESVNHLSVQTRGLETNSHEDEYSLGLTESIPFLSDNKRHRAKIVYVPGQLSVFILDTQGRVKEPALTVAVDLGDILSLTDGHAFVGFTASTGGAVETHDILRWSFASTAVPPGNTE
jgi:hypothetical protein